MSSIRHYWLATLVIAVLLSIAIGLAIGLVHEAVPGAPRQAVLAAAGLIAAALIVFLFVAHRWAGGRVDAVLQLSARGRALLGGDVHSAVGLGGLNELDELQTTVESLVAAIQRERTAANERRALIAEIVNGVPEGMIAIDGRRGIVLANQRFQDLFHATGPVVGLSLVELVRNPAVTGAFDRALKGEQAVQRTTLVVGSEQRQIEIRVSPVESSSEVAAVALFIDVTEIERLERIRREFLDDFSHEVRTPLAGLKSALETLEGEGLSESDEEHLRHIIDRQIARLESLTRDIAELNRIESREIELRREETDLLELARDAVGAFTASRPDLRIPVNVIGTETYATVDRSRVEQMLLNLIDNAVKHAANGEVTIQVADAADEAVLRVSDRGEGIPVDEQRRIFHRFYRVDKSRSQDVPGSGLGLAITKHLVLAHGGTIRVQSEVGKGSAFEIRLPKE